MTICSLPGGQRPRAAPLPLPKPAPRYRTRPCTVALIAIHVGLLFLTNPGCSRPPFEPPLEDVVRIRGRVIELTRASLSRASWDSPLSVSVTLEETNGRSLADFAVVGIWAYQEVDSWYPSEVETQYDATVPHLISAAAHGGPAWPSCSPIEMIITLHSEVYGYVSLAVTRGIVTSP